MILGTNWSATALSCLQGRGFVGSKLVDFTDALGIGGQNHVVGKPFTTTDTGTITGPGIGVGVGILGLIGATISTLVFGLATGSFGQSGSKLMDICDCVGIAAVSELGLAVLSSTHTPVVIGTGIIVPGSIAVIGSAWGSAIDTVGSGKGFIGSQWPNFAQAMGQGQATHILAVGTGSVVISGTPIGSPVPGSGVGVGAVS